MTYKELQYHTRRPSYIRKTKGNVKQTFSWLWYYFLLTGINEKDLLKRHQETG